MSCIAYYYISSHVISCWVPCSNAQSHIHASKRNATLYFYEVAHYTTRYTVLPDAT